jgi:excisionase family DNA binding protein
VNADGQTGQDSTPKLAPAGAKFLTLREAAELLHISTASLRRAYRRGALPAFLLGCSLRIARADLDAWVTAQRWTPSLCAERTARPRAGRRQARKAVTPVGPVGGQEATESEAVAAPSEGLQ